MAPLHSGWSHSQTAFLHPGQLPIPFSFKCAGMVVHKFKTWHDWRLHPTLRANDQLPHIDYLLKGAQNRLSQSLLFTTVYLNSQSSGHDITLTIYEPRWHRQCTRLPFRRAKSSLRTSLHSGVAPQKLFTGLTVSYSVHCQDWFIHYRMNDQCITMSQWLLLKGIRLCGTNWLQYLAQKCLDGMSQFLNSAKWIFLIFNVNVQVQFQLSIFPSKSA